MLGEKEKKYGVGEESEYESFTEPEKPWYNKGEKVNAKSGTIALFGYWILLIMLFLIISLLGALFE